MARLPRFFVPGEVLHVIQRGNNREPIFANENARGAPDILISKSSQGAGLLACAWADLPGFTGRKVESDP